MIGAALNPMVGAALTRVGARVLVGIGAGLMGAALAGLAVSGSFAVTAGAMALLGAAIAFLAAPATTLIGYQGQRSDPPALGGAYALYNLAYAVGLMLGPLAAGALTDRWGFTRAVAVLAVASRVSWRSQSSGPTPLAAASAIPAPARQVSRAGLSQVGTSSFLVPSAHTQTLLIGKLGHLETDPFRVVAARTHLDDLSVGRGAHLIGIKNVEPRVEAGQVAEAGHADQRHGQGDQRSPFKNTQFSLNRYRRIQISTR